jgi:hypothetical protein
MSKIGEINIQGSSTARERLLIEDPSRKDLQPCIRCEACKKKMVSTTHQQQKPSNPLKRKAVGFEKAEKKAKRKSFRSPFIIFSTDRRKQVQADNPGLNFGGIAKLIGMAWRSATPAEKSFYAEKSAEDKAKYLADEAHSEMLKTMPELNL